jgi:hypothetical protein
LKTAGIRLKLAAPVRLHPSSLTVAAAGLFLVLGARAARGKSWAPAALMAMYPAILLGILSTTAWRNWPLHWDRHPWLWAFRAMALVAASALWMRFYYVIWRLERRQRETPMTAGGRR